MFDDNLFAKVQYISGPLGPGPLPPPDLGIYINSISGKIIPTTIILAPLWILRPSYGPAPKKVKCFAQKCTKIENTRCGNTD